MWKKCLCICNCQTFEWLNPFIVPMVVCESSGCSICQPTFGIDSLTFQPFLSIVLDFSHSLQIPELQEFFMCSRYRYFVRHMLCEYLVPVLFVFLMLSFKGHRMSCDKILFIICNSCCFLSPVIKSFYLSLQRYSPFYFLTTSWFGFYIQIGYPSPLVNFMQNLG